MLRKWTPWLSHHGQMKTIILNVNEWINEWVASSWADSDEWASSLDLIFMTLNFCCTWHVQIDKYRPQMMGNIDCWMLCVNLLIYFLFFLRLLQQYKSIFLYLFYCCFHFFLNFIDWWCWHWSRVRRKLSLRKTSRLCPQSEGNSSCLTTTSSGLSKCYTSPHIFKKKFKTFLQVTPSVQKVSQFHGPIKADKMRNWMK